MFSACFSLASWIHSLALTFSFVPWISLWKLRISWKRKLIMPSTITGLAQWAGELTKTQTAILLSAHLVFLQPWSVEPMGTKRWFLPPLPVSQSAEVSASSLQLMKPLKVSCILKNLPQFFSLLQFFKELQTENRRIFFFSPHEIPYTSQEIQFFHYCWGAFIW